MKKDNSKNELIEVLTKIIRKAHSNLSEGVKLGQIVEIAQSAIERHQQ